MPSLVADLHGNALYSWPFTAFLVASVATTVLSGRFCDRSGPAVPLFAGPALFLTGLLVAGLAPTMAVLLLGRFLQGLGTGTLLVATTLLIALVFSDRERPVVYAANAAAWVLPAVLGPTVSGLVTVTVGWPGCSWAWCRWCWWGWRCWCPWCGACHPTSPVSSARRPRSRRWRPRWAWRR
jgi:MFS family permease